MSELHKGRSWYVLLLPPATLQVWLHADPILDCLVEDPATGLHRPRDYIQSLEARVAYLEDLLHNVRPDVALDHLAGADASAAPRAISPDGNTMGSFPSAFPMHASEVTQPPASGDTSVHNSDALHAAPGTQPSEIGDSSEIDMLSSEVAFLCLSAAGREPHYFGPSSAVSFSRIAGATMGLGRVGGAKSRLGAANSPQDRDLTLVDYYDIQEQFPTPAAAKRMSQAYWTMSTASTPSCTARLWMPRSKRVSRPACRASCTRYLAAPCSLS